MPTDSPWNVVLDQRLETLWLAGYSARVIGEMMQKTKNMVVGRAHRLQLPPRPSPVKERGSGERPKRQPLRAPVQTLPKLASVAAPVRQVAPMTAPAPAPKPAAPVVPRYPHCQFIKSKGRPWVWCDKPAETGTYCRACYDRVYTRQAA